MRRVFSLLAVVLLASPAVATAVRPSLARILVESDRIVVGVVTRAEGRVIDLRVDYVVYGSGTVGETIAVRTPRVSPTDVRRLSPELDRRLLLFLAGDLVNPRDPFRLVAVGGEDDPNRSDGRDEPADPGRTRKDGRLLPSWLIGSLRGSSIRSFRRPPCSTIA